jgi:hypothetical protein
MTDPWTDPDPQPGDFDAELATIDPGYLETHHGDADATQKILVSVEGRDAKRLERLATARGKKRATASHATAPGRRCASDSARAKQAPSSARNSPASTARFFRPTARGRPPRRAAVSASPAPLG